MKNEGLNAKQEKIVTIAAFTANGDLQKLKTALNEGLDNGLTVNEIKEILLQMYAYAGFPRSLNGINTFMTVMDERQTKGIKDEMGKEAGPIPADMNKAEYGAMVRARLAGQKVMEPPGGYQLFMPAIDTFLKEHLFSDIFARDNLDYQSRELATISALAAMTGTAGQLRFHLGAAMNTGLTEAQLKDFVSVLKSKVGKKEAETAHEILSEVLSSRPAEQSATSSVSTHAATRKAGGMKPASSLYGLALAEEMQGRYVRLAEIEINPAQLESYKAAAKEEIETSVRVEPGVLALFAVSEKDNPAHIMVFEMYADEDAYKAHLETPHFKKYKAATQKMVKSLKLVVTVPIILGAKAK